MMSEYRFWKAAAPLAAKIDALIDQWDVVRKAAGKLARKIGAKQAYYFSDAGSFSSVCGFIFKDETKVDRKLFVRLKGTDDGWRPRARTPLADEFAKLSSDYLGQIMQLVNMLAVGPDLRLRCPGFLRDGKQIYLALPADVQPKQCTRISDIAYERIRTRLLRRKAQKRPAKAKVKAK